MYRTDVTDATDIDVTDTKVCASRLHTFFYTSHCTAPYPKVLAAAHSAPHWNYGNLYYYYPWAIQKNSA